jgi:hypothetical protein
LSFIHNHPLMRITTIFNIFKKNSLTLCLLGTMLMPFYVKAQDDIRWKYYRVEGSFSAGPSNFLGELGGGSSVGAHYFKDLNFYSTRYAAILGLRYRVTQYTALRVHFTYVRLSGDDKLSDNYYRNYRNLSFRTNVFELSATLEVSLLKEQLGHRYRIKGVSGKKLLQVYPYVFGGVGIFHFNPQAEYKGKWYDLQPLGTEGQGLVPTRHKYALNQLCIPLGIGVKYAIDNRLSIGVEFGYRVTFTDYIDDVSQTYYDNDKIAAARGPIAAALADRSVNSDPNVTAAGQQRGNPNYTDAYMFATIGIHYKLYKSKSVSHKLSKTPRFEDCKI